MKPYQVVVLYVKQIGFLRGLFQLALFCVSLWLFVLVDRTETAYPKTMPDGKVAYYLTEHNVTFEWPLAAEKNSTKYRLLKVSLVVVSLLLFSLIAYDAIHLRLPPDADGRPSKPKIW